LSTDHNLYDGPLRITVAPRYDVICSPCLAEFAKIRISAAKPFADANRGGAVVALDFIDELTDAELVGKAEQTERQASAVLAATVTGP
jgi:hypothetical protein